MTRLPAAYAGRRPSQLSGGQKQRVGIARAFAGTPTLVVADEPVSGARRSVQAAIIALLADIQRTQQTTFIIISHDLGFVRYIADSVVVMYLGQIVEAGTVEQVIELALASLHRGTARGRPNDRSVKARASHRADR